MVNRRQLLKLSALGTASFAAPLAAEREVQFNAFMDASGYEEAIPYAPGILLDRTTKTVRYDGDEYRVKSQFLPLTTTNWATDSAKLKLIGDDSLRQDIANTTDTSKGAWMEGYRGRMVAHRLDDQMSANSVPTLSDLDAVTSNKFIPAGDYLFNGPNIETIGDIEVSKRAEVSNRIYSGIVQQDADVAWLQHNHLEQMSNSGNGCPVISSGNIPTAPFFNGSKQSHTNVLAYWYQDFGLEATRAAGAIGSTKWYDWSWLHHGASGDGYQPERHPWLGYYRGDDANVLDWQCYWLNEAGVTGVIPQTRGDGAQFGSIRATWATPSDVNNWLYKLLNSTPNFRQLTYALWAWSASDTNDAPTCSLIESSFTELVEIYNTYDNFNFVEKNGKIYPVVFAFETSFWRGAYDSYSGAVNTVAMLKAQAIKFRAKGWGGFCLIGRHNSTLLVGNQDLEASGVLVFDGAYTDTYNPALNGGADPAVDYEDLAIGADTRTSNLYEYRYSVPCVRTAAKSHSGHPSTWNWPGSTPNLFETMCRNALKRMSKNGNPRILTVYNVSEWAEGGPSLQPNMRDGKGYVYALRNALAAAPIVVAERNLYIKQSVQALSDPSVAVSVAEGAITVPLAVTFAWTSTASPIIQDKNPYNGKRLRLMLDNSSAHNGPLTLEDVGTRAGSGLRLTAATIGLSRNDSIEVEYDALQSLWVQVSPLVNVL